MAFWWIGGLAILLLFVWFVARAAAGTPARTEDTPEEILKRRYARGEINPDEYDKRLTDLRK